MVITIPPLQSIQIKNTNLTYFYLQLSYRYSTERHKYNSQGDGSEGGKYLTYYQYGLETIDCGTSRVLLLKCSRTPVGCVHGPGISYRHPGRWGGC